MGQDVSRRADYRPDIDGLRAVAVLAVILCHVGAWGMSGGFLGVDVFFVISGFLIHRDMTARLAAGHLSIPAFYGRRVRRTLPALYVCALLTATASLVIVLPGDLIALARSLLATLCGVPNLWFLSQVGYFDADAATKPLLHTWSLGVEEQFYLVAPLLALVLRGLAPRGRRGALAAGLGGAFVGTLVLQHWAPSAAFYCMPARVFEFAIGAIVAEGRLPAFRRRWMTETFAAFALVGLALCLVGFDEAMPHPGWPTLLPCLCVAALIHVGRDSRAGVLLSRPPLVAIGRISYSLYLYHWPILVLARYAELPTALPWRLGEATLLAALSIASYRLVEQPFRAPGSSWQRRAPAALSATAAILAACCVLTLGLGGFPGRFGREVDSLAAFSDYRDTKPFREGRCFVTSRDEAAGFDRGTCLALAVDRPSVLLLGDSHAAHLWTGLSQAWPHVHFLQATASGCKPLSGSTGERRCTELMRDMLERFIPAHRLDAVVLAALWTEADIAPLRRTLASLRAARQRVVVVGPLPRYDVPMAALLARATLHGDLGEVDRHRLPATASLDADMDAAVSPLATYVSAWQALCPRGECRLFAAPGVPMQFDYHHLTAQGAAVLATTLATREPGLFGAPASHGRLDLSSE